MKHLKMFGLCAMAVFALGAVASSSASAIEWKVEGAPLVGEEKLAKSVVVTENFVLTATGLPTITCSALEDEKGFIKGKTENGAEHLKFSNCVDTSDPAECEVVTPITTVPVSSTLEAGPPVKVKFKPTTGTEFVAIKIESKAGQTCAAEGTDKVKGTATGEAPNAGVESLTHKLKFTSTSGSALTFAEKAATFTGEAELELESKKKWSAS